MAQKPVVALSVPLGYYARNLLRSGIPAHVTAKDPDVRFVILSPAWNDPGFVAEFQREGTSFEPLHPFPSSPEWWERPLWKARYLMKGSQHAARALDAAIENLTVRRKRYYDAFFEQYQPALVVTGSPGFHSNKDVPLVREARQRGIRTLCVVFSWDNLMTHPVMLSRPDHLAVWNRHMREHAMDLHFYEPEALTIVGPPHFDTYQRRDTFVSREDYCKGLGLDPKRRILLVAAGKNSIVDNTFLLDILRTAQDKGDLPAEKIQIVVRPHPNDCEDPTRAFDPYRTDPHFVFDHASRWAPVLRWNPDHAEMRELANSLAHSDVVINVASTITLEAAVLDRPIINVCFSKSQPERFAKQILDFHYGGHYRPIQDHQCSAMVWNEGELLNAIHTYLDRPELHRQERRALAEDLCHRLDGGASERIADLILRLLEEEAVPLDGVRTAATIPQPAIAGASA